MTRLKILNYYRNCIYTNIDPHNCLHTKHTMLKLFFKCNIAYCIVLALHNIILFTELNYFNYNKICSFLRFFYLKKITKKQNGRHCKVIKVTPTKFIF